MPFEKQKNARYVAEFLGTLYLCLVIRLSTTIGIGTSHGDNDTTFAPFAIGFGLIAIIYQYGWISKAHYNPAVTIAFAVRGNVPVFHHTDYGQIAMYLLVEFVGGLIGAVFGDIIILGTNDNEIECNPGPSIDTDMYTLGQGFFAEFLFTFFLVFVILHVGTYQKGNEHYGNAIGFTVFSSILCIGNVTGCVLNPAVWFALNFASLICNDNSDENGSDKLSQVWVYFLSEFLAAIVCGLLFKYLFEPAGTETQENKFLIDDENSNRVRSTTNDETERINNTSNDKIAKRHIKQDSVPTSDPDQGQAVKSISSIGMTDVKSPSKENGNQTQENGFQE